MTPLRSVTRSGVSPDQREAGARGSHQYKYVFLPLRSVYVYAAATTHRYTGWSGPPVRNSCHRDDCVADAYVLTPSRAQILREGVR